MLTACFCGSVWESPADATACPECGEIAAIYLPADADAIEEIRALPEADSTSN